MGELAVLSFARQPLQNNQPGKKATWKKSNFSFYPFFVSNQSFCRFHYSCVFGFIISMNLQKMFRAFEKFDRNFCFCQFSAGKPGILDLISDRRETAF